MGIKRYFVTKLHQFRLMINGRNRTQYDIVMGILSSVFGLLVEGVTYLTVPEENLASKTPFLAVTITFAVFLTFFIYCSRHISEISESRWTRIVISIYPFLLLFGGLWVTYGYQGYSNRIDSYMISIMIAMLCQVYPLVKRVLFFSISMLLFGIMMYSIYAFSPTFMQMMRTALIMNLGGVVYTFVQYQIHINQKHSMDLLDSKSLHMKDALDKLQASHQITSAMLYATTEILKNDQLDDVLDLLLKEAVRLVPKAQAGSILIFNGKEMEFRAAYGYDLKKLQKITLRVEDIFQSTLKDKYQPSIIQNLEVFDTVHLGEEKSSRLRENGALIAKSILTCSFKYNNEFFGSMNLDNFDSTDIFNDDDKDLMLHLVKEVEIIIAIHKLYDKAIRPTKFDDLTGTYTRHYFRRLFEDKVGDAKKKKQPCVLAIIDINNLKETNDTYGHDTGDYFIQFFVNTVSARLPEGSLFGRMGGDEFAILFPNHHKAEVEALFSGIRQEHKTMEFHMSNIDTHVQFGFGLAEFPIEGEEFSDLMRIADQRMYQDKKISKERMS